MRSLSSKMTRAAALSATVALAGTAAAQQGLELPAPSPRAKTEQRVGITDFSIEYSSPGVKGRTIWGDLVPYDELWRAGANAATKLTASKDFTFGGKSVPAGSYAYYATPGRTTWTVVLNTNANTSGTSGYDEKNNVASVTVTPTKLCENRERMTFLFNDTTDDGANLDLEWADLRVRVPIKVDTKTMVMANVDKSLADAWRPHFASARYLLDTNGDMDQALEYVNTSIDIKPTWWNHWVKAQILRKKGDTTQAVSAANEAMKLGKGDNVYENFFKADINKAVGEWQVN